MLGANNCSYSQIHCSGFSKALDASGITEYEKNTGHSLKPCRPEEDGERDGSGGGRQEQ